MPWSSTFLSEQRNLSFMTTLRSEAKVVLKALAFSKKQQQTNKKTALSMKAGLSPMVEEIKIKLDTEDFVSKFLIDYNIKYESDLSP